MIHWYLCDKYRIEVSDRWYNPNPESVCENENAKILWDFSIQTDRKIDHCIVVHKRERIAMLIYITCPFDTRIENKDSENIEIYQDLKREIRSLWKLKQVTIIPIIIGACALGKVYKNIKSWIKKLGQEPMTQTDLFLD